MSWCAPPTRPAVVPLTRPVAQMKQSPAQVQAQLAEERGLRVQNAGAYRSKNRFAGTVKAMPGQIKAHAKVLAEAQIP